MLVKRMAKLDGWMSLSSCTDGDRSRLQSLVEDGYVQFCKRVPGQTVACYRLIGATSGVS